MALFEYVSDEYWSNCIIEALRAKARNPSAVTLYFCKPDFSREKHQGLHFMWSDGQADYDFSDFQDGKLPWYKCLLFNGKIRRFPLGFAKKYAEYRNGRRNRK